MEPAVSTILLAAAIVTVALTAALAVFVYKLKKRVDELGAKIEDFETRSEEVSRRQITEIREELGRQRTLMTQSLSSINDNVTRGVINMSKKQ